MFPRCECGHLSRIKIQGSLDDLGKGLALDPFAKIGITKGGRSKEDGLIAGKAQVHRIGDVNGGVDFITEENSFRGEVSGKVGHRRIPEDRFPLNSVESDQNHIRFRPGWHAERKKRVQEQKQQQGEFHERGSVEGAPEPVPYSSP